MIADPTGKPKIRKQLTKKEVETNAKSYQEQILKILNSEQTTVKFNSEWLEKMNFRYVIELASRCTVARIIERGDFNSKGDIRRVYEQGGVEINGERVQKINSISDIADQSIIKVGKGKFYIVCSKNKKFWLIFHIKEVIICLYLVKVY